MKRNKFTAIDLFCGAGGLTLGLKNAGFKVLAGIELNAIPAKTFRANHPRVKLYEQDIRTVEANQILADLNLVPGQLDLLAGCPPCQGFSTHRTRNRRTSTVDERNDLVFEFFRLIEKLHPKTIMLENVPGLGKNWRTEELKNRLSELGYYIDDDFSQVKNASEFGVPQRRKRLLIKASRYGKIPNATPSNTKCTVRQAIHELPLPGHSGDPIHDVPEIRSEKVRKIISSIPKNGGSRSDIPKSLWLNCHLKNEGYRDVYGRMSWDDVAPTITGGCHNPSKGRFLHPEQDRAITLREASLLQTFPKDYKFSISDGKEAIALMIGNALPPKFIENHAKEYANHLKEVYSELIPKI